MNNDSPVLGAPGLHRFEALRTDAISAVTQRFYADQASIYARFGERGRVACRDDLAFHLEFLRPVLEFGLVQPMVDYLRWLAGVLAARDVPVEHLAQSLDWLGEFFVASMGESEGEVIATALRGAKTRYLVPDTAAPAIYRMMPDRWPECDAFEAALLAGDRAGAGSVFDGCLDRGRSLLEAELHLIQPALYGIGRKWQDNQVTVAQEHLATAISQAVMTGGLLRSDIPASNGRRVLLACVECNNHAIGLQMVGDAFQLAGWDVQYLGANVPTQSLIAHVGECRPDLLGLSVSFAQQLRVVKDIVARLTSEWGAKRPPVLIGGLAINQFSNLAPTLGADAWSPDARAALGAGESLLLSPGAQ